MALINQVLTATGTLTLVYFLVRISRFIYIFFIRSSSLPRYAHGSNNWALITGSTDGIGLGFAHELASAGFSIILHGRDPAKLERVEDTLRASYPSIGVRTFVLDAKTTAPIADSNIAKVIDGCNLTILINNVGKPGPAENASEIDEQININARFITQLTAYLLPQLKAHSPALILNIGSSAELGSPWISVYAGSKAFVTSWSKSLAAEMRAEGHAIEVMSFRVSEVRTAGNPAQESWSVVGARPYARMALDRVGCGVRSVSPYWFAAVQRGVAEALPEWVLEGMLIKTLRGRRKLWEEKRAKKGL